MSYLPHAAPVPDPEPWEAGFWRLCAEHRLCFQRCTACGHVRHPPLPCCPRCRCFESGWIEATDDAELYTYTIVHHALHPSLRDAVPYNAVVVAFPALAWIRLVSNIINCPPEQLRIGMPLRVCWDVAGNGRILPRFEPKPRLRS